MLDLVKTFRPPGGRTGARDRPGTARSAGAFMGKLTTVGVAVGVYSMVEPYLFRLNVLDVPLGSGAPQLDVLHVSDTHMRSKSRRLRAWLRRLPEELGRVPDLVVATGDLIEDDTGIDPIVDALTGLEARYGRFYVLGSHDYFQSKFQTYAKYFTGLRPIRAPRADTDTLESGLAQAGWVSVTNATEQVETPGGRIRVTGVDDPYIHRHRTEHIRREPNDDLAIGLVHAPDVVSEYALAGFDLVVAGHTHAGQVRPPAIGAVVTNCTLPSALGGGLNEVGETWLHVSPGLGSGRFAPIRFNCRPEATLLRLRPTS